MEAAFVILLHQGLAPTHYDMMLSLGQVLDTWQFADNPLELLVGGQITGRKIQGHRVMYLDYEGPVSKGRGHVTRVDAGQYHTVRKTDALWVLVVEGRSLSGTFELCTAPDGSDAWTLRRKR